MAFAINSAPFELVISVRKHRSLNTTKRHLKGPNARGCKPLFSSAPHSTLGLQTQLPPSPPPSVVHARQGSRFTKEGHNSCSMRRDTRLHPPPWVSVMQRKEGEGRGAQAQQWRPGPRPLFPARTCSGRSQVGREGSLHASPSRRARAGAGECREQGESTKASMLLALASGRWVKGALSRRVFRKPPHHCVHSFPTGFAAG